MQFYYRLNGTIATNIVVEILGVKKKRGIVSTMQSASNMSPFYFRPQLNQVEDFGHVGPTVWVDWCLGTPWVLYFFNGKSDSDEPLNFYIDVVLTDVPTWLPRLRLPGCYS